MFGEGKLLGWIAALAFAKNKRFDEGQRKVLAIVGSRAAAAIDNARLYEDLQATFQQLSGAGIKSGEDLRIPYLAKSTPMPAVPPAWWN